MDLLKIKKFLFSNKNIIGCLLASTIIILGFIGMIKSFWLPIAVMSYIFGVIATPEAKEIKFIHLKNENLNDYLGFINKLHKTVELSEKLPIDAKNNIHNIIKTAIELINFLQKGDQNLSLSEDLINLTSIFDSYLPKIINQYERLPSKYANEIKASNGKTARQMLIEQLSILQKKVEEIAYGMYENDVTALRANGI
jgi:hypothetical protein